MPKPKTALPWAGSDTLAVGHTSLAELQARRCDLRPKMLKLVPAGGTALKGSLWVFKTHRG